MQFKSKAFSFYNHIFIFLYNLGGEHLSSFKEIHEIYEKNLNSATLTLELVTFKLLKVMQAGHQEKIKLVLPLTQILNENNIYYLDQIIVNLLADCRNSKYLPAISESLRSFYERVNF